MSERTTRQPPAETAREMLDEVRESLRYCDSWVSRDRETELRIEAARGYLWLAQVEAAELAAGKRAAVESLVRRQVERGIVPGWPLEPETGDAP